MLNSECVSIQALQPRSHIGDADSWRRLFPARGQARAVVIDAQREHAVRARCRNPYGSSLHSFCDPMFHRVLHHGLQDQAGHLRGKQFRRHVHADLKSLGESHFLDVQILLSELQFLSQRHLLPAGIFHHPTQKVA